MKFPLKNKVDCLDGPGGKLVAVVLEAGAGQISHLVVEQAQKPHADRLVPAERIGSIHPGLLELNCTQADLLAMDPFTEIERRPKKEREYPAALHAGEPDAPADMPPEMEATPVHHIPPGGVVIRRDMRVEATDGWLGEVQDLLVDPAGSQVTHLVLREGHFWGEKEMALPVSMIGRVAEESLFLKMNRQALASRLAAPVMRGQDITQIGLIIFTFDQKAKADRALKTLKQFGQKEGSAVLNVALLVKDSGGRATVKESEDVSPRHGALFGAITGGLIGLLGGPVGAVIGAAAGAATGSTAAHWLDMGFPEEYLHRLQRKLAPGSAALVVLVRQEAAGRIIDLLADAAGDVVYQAMTEEMLTHLSADQEEEQ